MTAAIAEPGAALTPTCQNEPFTTAALLAALEQAWAAIQAGHPDVPTAVIVVGSGSPARRSASVKYGHFAALRWQLGESRLPEVLVSGEGLRRSPAECSPPCCMRRLTVWPRYVASRTPPGRAAGTTSASPSWPANWA
jgi:hypothetical protein